MNKYLFPIIVFVVLITNSTFAQTKFQANVTLHPFGITNSSVTLKDELPRKDRFDIKDETTFGAEANVMLIRNNKWRFIVGYSAFKWRIGFDNYLLNPLLQPPFNTSKNTFNNYFSELAIKYPELLHSTRYTAHIAMEWNILMHGVKLGVGRQLCQKLFIEASFNFLKPSILKNEGINSLNFNLNLEEDVDNVTFPQTAGSPRLFPEYYERVTEINNKGKDNFWEVYDFVVPEININYELNNWSSVYLTFGYKFYSNRSWKSSPYSITHYGDAYSTVDDDVQYGSRVYFANKIQYLKLGLSFNLNELIRSKK